MPLINCNVELKLRWTKHCVLSVAGIYNANGNNDDNDIAFTIKNTKLYVPVVTLSARDNQKLSKLLSKGFERSIYWNKYKKEKVTGQGEDYTTGCLLDFYYNKNHYRLIAVALSRQKELDDDPKAIQQIEFVGQFKKLDNKHDHAKSMFILTILEKIKERRLKSSQESVTVL